MAKKLYALVLFGKVLDFLKCKLVGVVILLKSIDQILLHPHCFWFFFVSFRVVSWLQFCFYSRLFALFAGKLFFTSISTNTPSKARPRYHIGTPSTSRSAECD